MPRITLVDVADLVRQSPDAPAIPTETERGAMSVGDFAKLTFASPGAQNELVWYEVSRVVGPGVYDGDVNGKGVRFAVPRRTRFDAKHIGSIMLAADVMKRTS